jgi:predicted O-linked N-acetylglucosamine transferase (SPINDLY family)
VAKQNILLRSKKKKALGALEANRIDEAWQLFSQLSRAVPMDAEIWAGLAVAEGKRGNHAVAARYFQKAASIQPDSAQVQYNLGVALRDSGNEEQSVSAFEKATRLNPQHGEAFDCLAHVHMMLGNLDQAAEVFQKALTLQPGKAETHSNLGSVYQAKGCLSDAEACYREALAIKPGIAIAENLGSVLTAQGRFEEAIEVYRRGLERQPNNARLLSNLLLTLNYLPDLDQDTVFREHRNYNRVFTASPRFTEFSNSRDRDRKLRIGYVSPDFREHSVAYYIEPVLEGHDRRVIEVYGYSAVPRPDQVARRLEAACDHWVDISRLSLEQTVERVRKDEIDILVDLAGHTAHNSLALFARRPAPVGVSYLGYPNTTGLDTIAWRIVDATVDPADQDQFYTEKLMRLPGCFLCYKPPPDAPPVHPLPALEAGRITFGSFNNLSKINDDVIRLWSDVVKAVPGSRLLVKNPSLTDENTRLRYRDKFHSHGISDNSVELIGHTPTRQEHLALYGRVDIALDTFPYNGTTTTCEALWMGVPVLTLSGHYHAARVGVTLLQAAGLEEWVSASGAAFVAHAVGAAGDLDNLANLRASLRGQLLDSDLCNTRQFLANLERAYRLMWREWLG